MEPNFDPYLAWLGISAPERPVNHYDLLGLVRGESDSHRINEQALARSAIVRKYQLGRHSDLSQRVLNEISAARICLLDPARRAAYDASLDRQAAAVAEEEIPLAELVSTPATPARPLPPLPQAWPTSNQPNPLSGPLLLAIIAVPCLVLLGLGLLMAVWFSSGPTAPVADRPGKPRPNPPAAVIPQPAPLPAPAPVPLPPPPIPTAPPVTSKPRPGSLPAGPRIRNPANGHDYQRINQAMSWHEASDYCDSLGGYLATATTALENQFIFQNFAQDRVIWLGATDEDQEGKWRWITGEEWNFANWGNGEPSNHGGKEHYVCMGNCPGVTFQGRPYFYRFGPRWNDHEASGDYFKTLICHPVCEWDQR